MYMYCTNANGHLNKRKITCTYVYDHHVLLIICGIAGENRPSGGRNEK